jgi:hypothetical protein
VREVQAVLLPLAEGKLLRDTQGHTPTTHVETAIESLVDFCLFPGFLRDIYTALDCRLECSNLLEDIVHVLAKRAQNRLSGRRVRPANLIALKGLVAMFDALAAVPSLPSSIFVPPKCIFTSQASEDLWDAVVKGTSPACEVRNAQLPPCVVCHCSCTLRMLHLQIAEPHATV